MTRPQLTTVAILAMLAAPAPAPAAPPSRAELRRMLVTRVDVQHQATGIVVGIVAPGGPQVVAYGTRGLDDKRPVTADTVFDIGSITKLFTALLLADRRGLGVPLPGQRVAGRYAGLPLPLSHSDHDCLAKLSGFAADYEGCQVPIR